MSERSVADDLESALRDRAQRLADEHLAHARQIREQIIQEENERLRLREEREVLAAKDLAERDYRRRVQASELQLHEKLERQRWEWIQEILRRLGERLAELARDEQRYLPFLKALLAEAAGRIPEGELVAALNDGDRGRFGPRWNELAAEAVPQRSLTLSEDTLSCAGGVLLHDQDNRVMVDNTFEGRTERLHDELERVIGEHLFARAGELGDLSGG